MTAIDKKKKVIEDFLIASVCANCKHWDRLEDVSQSPGEDISGECIRYPPKIIGLTEDEELIQRLPVTEARFSCGEHAGVQH